ncbi:MAG: septum formation protein Maf [Promethearchaeota archaeon]|nr:MAG: septum formation protein Maf [Candidatus Lokiarchaeota archaeon]
MIVLASKSADRNRLLENIKLPFEVYITNVDENKYKTRFSNPIELVKQLAKAKALKAKDSLSKEGKKVIIIAADTVVELNGKIIGKAKNEEKAFHILKKLAGKIHNLLTGFAITETNNSKLIVEYDNTSVKFINLTDQEIWSYIKSGEWKGRAGAYSIREKASLFIEAIQGSSSNVIGLPMHKIFRILKNEFNYNLL